MPTLSRRHVVGAALGGAMAAMIPGVGTELVASMASSAKAHGARMTPCKP